MNLQQQVASLLTFANQQLQVNSALSTEIQQLHQAIHNQQSQVQSLRVYFDELSKQRQGLMGPVSPFPLETPASTYFFAAT